MKNMDKQHRALVNCTAQAVYQCTLREYEDIMQERMPLIDRKELHNMSKRFARKVLKTFVTEKGV